jgi:hypothetical protein
MTHLLYLLRSWVSLDYESIKYYSTGTGLVSVVLISPLIRLVTDSGIMLEAG